MQENGPSAVECVRVFISCTSVVNAIKRVEEIKEKRQAQFIKNRYGMKIGRPCNHGDVLQTEGRAQAPRGSREERSGTRHSLVARPRRYRRAVIGSSLGYWCVVCDPVVIGKKVRAAQRQRQAAATPKAVEMETAE